MPKTSIYILKLEGGNYYVGRSTNLKQRIKDHFDGNGSAWTNLHKPKELIDNFITESHFEEDRYVKEYMSK